MSDRPTPDAPTSEPESDEPRSETTQTTPPSPESRRLMSRYDVIASLLLLALWLVPITLAGGFKTSLASLPAYMRDLQRIACLFTDEAKSWPTYHIQIQTHGNATWEELPLAGYFDIDTFGYRNHIERILSHSFRRGGGRGRMFEIADYARKRYAEKHPEGPKLDAVRFVQVKHPLRALAQQSGHFVRKALKNYPENWQTPFGERRYDGKRASVDHRGKKLKSTKTKRSKKPKREHTPRNNVEVKPSTSQNPPTGGAPSR